MRVTDAAQAPLVAIAAFAAGSPAAATAAQQHFGGTGMPTAAQQHFGGSGMQAAAQQYFGGRQCIPTWLPPNQVGICFD